MAIGCVTRHGTRGEERRVNVQKWLQERVRMLPKPDRRELPDTGCLCPSLWCTALRVAKSPIALEEYLRMRNIGRSLA